MKKIIIGTLCSTILLGGVILPTTSVFAEEAVTKTENTYLSSENKKPAIDDISVNEVRKYAEEIGIKVNDSEITITDSQMLELFKVDEDDVKIIEVNNKEERKYFQI